MECSLLQDKTSAYILSNLKIKEKCTVLKYVILEYTITS